MLERISSQELTEWMAYYQLEPFGQERADLGPAIVASVVANVNRDPKQRARPYEPADFMPDFEPRQERRDNSQRLLGIAEALNAALGGKDLRR